MVRVINHRGHGRKPLRVAVIVVLIVVLLGGSVGGGVLYARPLPDIIGQPAATSQPKPAAAVDMPWPGYGQSAVGLAGSGILATSGAQRPQPTASVAKVMTALAVLKKKPLAVDQPGPNITITRADMERYNWYLANDGSLAAMQEGQQINQYDALQALLLPSANNFADALARWAFGSMEEYVKYANELAGTYGMEQSYFADASGYSPETVSTADDLVRLGDKALQNPVLAQIVAKQTAQIPVAGTIYNTNGLLRRGLTGIKTGNTDQAGGVFLAAAKKTLASGKEGTVIVCVMGGPNLDTAMLATLPLLDATAANVVSQTVIRKGQSFGTYAAPWTAATVKAVAKSDVTLQTWRDSNTLVTASLKPLSGSQAKGAAAGTASVTAGTVVTEVPLVLDSAISSPGWLWRITR